ncbi:MULTISPECIES: LysR family transcriptional regulator [Aeromonas]|uniref:Transcriptional regulator, LysR family n=1 Tax=Aeromonas hydrophila subsp. hydrophila (strain ATCC 7966 / DSM 30187 / BCRC 13018 / CCUG 14551 / JCM 1027 / KCTC 2358 / NCIMB 9240 / NCTC 8049) TaxID=380703 RepID=A0KKW4_AERHH|nr:LysR family transcriptional regulator [Aeromonas hydrophila]ABK39701.1 transcriptional regulator, LysR family [Aeromonas hydrophila subsp. hydrophila ATCC 7966]MBS4671595.1 LysR family transcriptional regulator [Aeromonas hydrophila]OOD33629.1 LysR family transcriptional regulator [Aeromonas hydrophila]SUU28702.1 LysR family transcriptional regulator [Aeromonas hydrophila]
MLLEGLETLCLLASEGTMAKVASRLYISQSAVSKRIAQLEQRLGKKLVEPDGRQIRLTPQAQELLARVAPSLAEMKGVLADSQTLTDLTPLPVACSETLLAGYLARFMHDYLRQDPHLALSTHHTPVILARVRSGDALLGICAGRLPPGHGLEAKLLLEEPFYLVEGDQREGENADQGLRQILTMDLDNPSNRYLREPLAALGLIPAMELDSYLALIELAKAGIGPVLLPAGLLALVGAQGPQARPLAGLARPLHLVYRPNSLKRARIAQLVQALQAHFQPLAS